MTSEMTSEAEIKENNVAMVKRMHNNISYAFFKTP